MPFAIVIYFIFRLIVFCHQHHQLHRLSFERKTLYIFYWNIFRTYFFFVLIIMIPNAFLKEENELHAHYIILTHLRNSMFIIVYLFAYLNYFPGENKTAHVPN